MGFKQWAENNKPGGSVQVARQAKIDEGKVKRAQDRAALGAESAELKAGWAEKKAERAQVKETAQAERDAGAPARAVAKRDAHLAQLDRKAAALEKKEARPVSFEGVTLKSGQVRYKGTGGAVKGATARVESAADVRGRITATRVLAIGVFALAAKKQAGHVFLTVEAPGFEFVVEVPVKKEADARGFAAKINNAAKAGA